MRSVIVLLLVLFLSFNTWAQAEDFKHVNFDRADNLAALHKGESLQNLPLLSYNLTHSLKTDVEKFRAIYLWVCQNIESDYEYFTRNKRKRKKLQGDSLGLAEWNREFSTKVFQRLLEKKRTVCTGYAYLVMELCNLADIECVIVDGYGRSSIANIGGDGFVNHSWNAVKLSGKWYLCDATWSTGRVDLGSSKFEMDYSEAYFLTRPSLFAKGHYPLDRQWLLLEEMPTLDSFLNGPLIYREGLEYQLEPLAPVTMKVSVSKGEDFICQLQAHRDVGYEDLQFEWVKRNRVIPVKPEITQADDGFVELRLPCNSRGQYDVHLKKGTAYLMTFTIVTIK